MRSFPIAVSVAIGMAAGCIPIAGYNIGAEKKDRARALFSRLLLAELILGAAAPAVAEAFPVPIAMPFGAENESAHYTGFTVKCFRIYLCLMPLAALNKGTFIYLQALGRALASAALSMTRKIVFGVSLPLILPILFGLDGLLRSFPAADLLAFVLAALLIRRTFRPLSDGNTGPGRLHEKEDRSPQMQTWRRAAPPAISRGTGTVRRRALPIPAAGAFSPPGRRAAPGPIPDAPG